MSEIDKGGLLHNSDDGSFCLMFSSFLDLLHGIFPLIRRFDLCSSHSHDLDAGKIGLESMVEREAICFRNFTRFWLFEEDFELGTCKRLQMTL